jgi:hypothetical protein
MSLGAVLDDAQFRGPIAAGADRVLPSTGLTFVAHLHQQFESLQRTLLRDRDAQTGFLRWRGFTDGSATRRRADFRINSLRTVPISLCRTGQTRPWARPFQNASPAFV